MLLCLWHPVHDTVLPSVCSGGPSGGGNALEASTVLAFPTMIFIDRKGDVRMIHTGFSGPGTGQHYLQFVGEFKTLMDELLEE